MKTPITGTINQLLTVLMLIKDLTWKVKDRFQAFYEKNSISDFRKTVGQLERDYVKGIIDVDGNPCDESQFNWRNFCAGTDLNSISLLLFCLGRIS